MISVKIALIGNQNCGKTTLFNRLTGENAHVGNFPGVTVEGKSGIVKGHKDIIIVDLPGIYSLRPYSSEEIVSRDFIVNEKPDVLLNIVDATNLERNLYLTVQLIEMRVPMVLALNMMDEVRAGGGVIDVGELSRGLGIPVVPISAAKNEGMQELFTEVADAASLKKVPLVKDMCHRGPVHRCIHSLSHMVEDHAERVGISPRFAAMKLIEGDSEFVGRLGLSQNELESVEHLVTEMETEGRLDRNAALAKMRYDFIEEVMRTAVKKSGDSPEKKRSEKIDRVLTHRFFAIPIFLLIMLGVFYLTFNVIGSFLSDLLALGVDRVIEFVDKTLTGWDINPAVRSLVVDGALSGIGSVLSFLPIIVVLFFFLSLLEDTGYMARVSFVMDKALRALGLSGRSFVPMIIGFGCTVPAVMATRTLPSDRDRKMTMLLLPFMSCSAKIPIYAVFSAAFFPHRGALVMFSMYIIGMAVGVLAALVMNKVAFKGTSAPFVMELPNYRFPTPKTTFRMMWDKAKGFIEKAFTVIFAASIIIWFLTSFDSRLNYTADNSVSILAMAARKISPIFAPLGFDDFRAVIALISGFSAKEAVVSTLGVLLGASSSELPLALSGIFTPLSAFSFLIFNLLYTPCVAAIASYRKEMSTVGSFGVIFMQCVVAWIASFAVFNLGGLILTLF